MLSMIQSTGKGEKLLLTIDPGADGFEGTSGPTSVPESSNPKAASAPRKIAAMNLLKRPVYPELKAHFAILNISETSSDEAIRRHYRRLARLWHPDKNPENAEEAKAKFQAIQTAYDAIKLKLHL